jgi:hypothetical protein
MWYRNTTTEAHSRDFVRKQTGLERRTQHVEGLVANVSLKTRTVMQVTRCNLPVPISGPRYKRPQDSVVEVSRREHRHHSVLLTTRPLLGHTVNRTDHELQDRTDDELPTQGTGLHLRIHTLEDIIITKVISLFGWRKRP